MVARISLLVAAVLALAASCRDARDSAPEEPPAGAAPAVAPSGASLGAIVRRAHFAFRRDGDAWTGGHDTYASRVAGRALRVTPRGGDQRGADFVAVTEAVQRGRARLDGRARAPEAGPDAAVAIDHGRVVERFENTEDGVEQSWHFAEAPEGDGDLQVSLRVSGLDYTGETAGGLHFADPETGLGVRYGVATWIDARGARTAVKAAFDGGAIVLTVPAAVVAASAYPAVLDPMVSPEYGTDNAIQIESPGDQTQPAVAFGGGQYLIVWQELRVDAAAPDIWGARIDAATGAMLDPVGIQISTFTGAQSEPAVAFDGTNWMVVWKDTRLKATGEIYGARVSTAGAVLDPTGFPIATGNNKGLPAVSCGGGSCLVAYGDDVAPNTLVKAVLVAPNGLVLSPQPINTFLSGYDKLLSVSAAFNGTDHLVVSSVMIVGGPSYGGVQAARVSTSGTVLGNVAPYSSSSSGNPVAPNSLAAVASDGIGWLISFYVRPPLPSTSNCPRVVRVSATGTALDSAGIAVIPGCGSLSTVTTSVAYGNGNYVVQTGNGYYRVVAPNGTPLGPSNVFLGASTSTLPIASNGAGFLLAKRLASTNAGNPGDIHFERFYFDSVSSTVLGTGGFVLSTGAPVEQSPAVAWNGTNFLVVWEDRRPGTNIDIWGARLSPSGTVLDPAGIPITQASGDQFVPAVASNGTDWLVAWEDKRAGTGQDDIYATRVLADGTVTNPTGIPINTIAAVQSAPSIASNGTDYLVVWDGPANNVAAARVTAAGTVLDTTAFNVLVAKLSSVAWNGTNYLVAGQSLTTNVDIYAARVTPAGTVLDASPILVANTAANETRPSVASDGNNWLVAWEVSSKVRAARISPAGAVLDNPSLSLSVAAGVQASPRVAWDGTQYWTVFTADGAGQSDLFAIRLAPTGGGKDPTAITVSSTPYAEQHPSLVAGPGKSVMVSYDRMDPAAPWGSTRVRSRVLSDLAGGGGACALAADCATGFCVDGVCCDTACAGLCTACTAAKKGTGADGVCGPVMVGADPDNECAQQAASTCGTTGACNGAGACQLHPAGTACGGSCNGSVAQALTCNGTGTCTATGSMDCAPYACAAGACKTSCTINADCAAGRVCAGGACVMPAANGAPCASAATCQSGFCADGVCCDAACNGACLACSAAKKGQGADGACGPVVAGADPDNECAQQAASTCGTTGACDGAGACQKYAAGTSCGASVCQGNVAKGQLCDGNGACTTSPAGQDCAPYVCAAGSCKSTCAADGDCVSGYVCAGGTCQQAGGQGLACTTGADCQSGFCVDGVCCDSSCTSKCQACSAAKKGQGANGACGPIKGGTDPDNECAVQAAATCGQNGFCDGAGACARHAAGTVCAAGGCANGAETPASLCDGAGTCVAGAATSCVPGYACVAGACATGCSDDTSCAPGYACDTSLGGCVAKPDAGTGGSGTGGSGTGGAGTGGSGNGGSGTGGNGTGGTTGTTTTTTTTTTDTNTTTTGTTTTTATTTGTTTSSQGTGGSGSGGDSGCGCRVAGEDERGSGAGAGAAVMLAALAGLRRARTRRARRDGQERLSA